MARRLGFVAGVLVLLVAVVAASVPARPQDDWTIFTDPSGDAKGAADITKVALSHSEAAGTFTIEITTVQPTFSLGRPAATPPTITTYMLRVYLDTDRNAATGQPPGGYEYVFENHRNSRSRLANWYVLAWNGMKLESAAFTPVTSYNGYGLFTWTIKRSDVGNPTSFALRVSSGGIVDGPTGNTSVGPDSAPETGSWAYDLIPTPLPPATTATTPTQTATSRPVIASPSSTPTQARAGKRFTVAFRVTRSDTGGPLMSGTMICDPSVAGTILKHTESFTGGTARLSSTLPRGSKGKLLRVKVAIRSGSHTSTRVATFRIR